MVFEGEWFGDYGDGQDVYFFGQLCYYWCGIGVGIVVYVGGDEYYVCILQGVYDVFVVFQCGLVVDFWVCVGVQVFGDVGIQLQLQFGVVVFDGL